MVEMRDGYDDAQAVARFQQQFKRRDRVRAAGNGGGDAIAGPKETLGMENNTHVALMPDRREIEAARRLDVRSSHAHFESVENAGGDSRSSVRRRIGDDVILRREIVLNVTLGRHDAPP